MKHLNLNSQYWQDRYTNKEIGWDTGAITNPLKDYIDQIKDKSVRILIPGCGNSYELEYLFENGFKNVFVLDYAKSPIENIAKRLPNFPKEQLLHADFFSHESQYDIILEQTFFCALNPDLRQKYVQKMHELLVQNGKLVGLFFQFPLTESGPPFGGSKEEYQNLFSNTFVIQKLETAYNSIKPRKGNELFFIFTKK